MHRMCNRMLQSRWYVHVISIHYSNIVFLVSGIGRYVIDNILTTRARVAGVSQLAMTVISCRHELIAYYSRCGFVPTDAPRVPFPDDPRLGTPLVAGLEFIEMAKQMS